MIKKSVNQTKGRNKKITNKQLTIWHLQSKKQCNRTNNSPSNKQAIEQTTPYQDRTNNSLLNKQISKQIIRY